jgi:hypothetical protein
VVYSVMVVVSVAVLKDIGQSLSITHGV